MQLVERRVQRFGAAKHFAELVLQDLGVQKLLGIFPLIERSGFVEALIALQPDHFQPAPRRDRLGELGFTDARRAFDQDRLFDLLREVDRGRDLAARNIALRGEAVFDSFNGSHRPMFSHEYSLPICQLFELFCLRSRQRTSLLGGRFRGFRARFGRAAPRLAISLATSIPTAMKISIGILAVVASLSASPAWAIVGGAAAWTAGI